ncbi:hypothetical protein Vafri_15831 [Volvox africanus]|uniref:Uncharacterized protein n=1 Tax=Volvox africanus TaxID=51714 RepID=A0A8J4BH04_9CHLO|nr:hypothetical protein Vafri_15831 [Volvox africanus]
MKMMHGAFFRAFVKRSRRRDAPTLTNISTSDDDEMLKNSTPTSPATAQARSVLPQPGGPESSTPWVYLVGFLRKSATSTRLALAVLMPATSANVTPVASSASTTVAWLFPGQPQVNQRTPCANV